MSFPAPAAGNTLSHGVYVRENYNPGAIVGVDVAYTTTPAAADWVQVATRTAAAGGSCPRTTLLYFATPLDAVRAVRLRLNTTAVPSWQEIDAVGLWFPAPLRSARELRLGNIPDDAVYADDVLTFSSEASSGAGAAAQVIGPADVTSCGDDPSAWSTATADAAGESIAVVFPADAAAYSGLYVRESFNPDAVTSVDVATTATPTSGDWVRVYTRAATVSAACPQWNLFCFDRQQPVRAVRVGLASETVAGFNQIDSIALKRTGGLLATRLTTSDNNPRDVLWASGVISYSSQFGTSTYAATQATGAPNVLTCASHGNAWTAATENGPSEHLAVSFNPSAGQLIHGIYVRESYNPGAIVGVDIAFTPTPAASEWTEVHTRAAAASGRCPRLSHYHFVTPQLGVRAVRLRLANDVVAGWNEIDAVGLKTSTQYADRVRADAPVAYYRLGEPSGATAWDEMGLSNGTYTSGPVLGAAGALTEGNTAVRFDGSDDAVQIPDVAALRLNGSFSIEFWAKLNVFTNTWPGILYKGNAVATGYIIWYGNTGYIDFKRAGVSCIAPASTLTTSFRHLAVVHDATAQTLKWFADGALAHTCTGISYPTNTDATALALGRGDHYGSTTLDEVAFYNYALDPAQLQQHRAAGPYCGNGVCDASFENCGSCAADCTTCVASATLTSGERLTSGQCATSADGRFSLCYQTDGHLVLYQSSVGAIWWNSMAGSTLGRVEMQTDGNLVQYNASNTAVWSSMTTSPGAILVVQNNGNMVIWSTSGVAVWATQTGGR